MQGYVPLAAGVLAIALLALYVWAVVRAIREVQAAEWLRGEELAQTVWFVVIIVWVPVGVFAWMGYQYWKFKSLTQDNASKLGF